MSKSNLALAPQRSSALAPPELTVERRYKSLALWYETDSGAIDFYSVDAHTDLLPEADLRRALVEIKQALEPASPKEATSAAGMLIAGYPKRDHENPEMFARLMVLHMSDYPADVLMEAVKEIHRTCKFFPTIAEMCAAAEKAVRDRRALKRSVERMLGEYRRREARGLEQRQREADERQKFEEWYARLAGIYGVDAVPPIDDLEYAEKAILFALGFSRSKDWHKALATGLQWALRAWWRFALVGQLLPGYYERRIDGRAIIEITELSGTDYGAARARVCSLGNLGRPEITRYHDQRVMFDRDLERWLSDIFSKIETSDLQTPTQGQWQRALDLLRAEGKTAVEIEAFLLSVLNDDPAGCEKMAAMGCAPLTDYVPF